VDYELAVGMVGYQIGRVERSNIASLTGLLWQLSFLEMECLRKSICDVYLRVYGSVYSSMVSMNSIATTETTFTLEYLMVPNSLTDNDGSREHDQFIR
jgi:hypothetical protein